MDYFWGPGDAKSFSKKIYSAQLDTKIQTLLQNLRNKLRMRGPPLCVRVSGGAGKNEFMAKTFLQKITGKLLTFSSPHYGGMDKTVKT